MKFSLKFKIVISMVKTDLTDHVVDAAKAAGGTGATIIPARGTGIREARTFFGLTLEAHTDVILFLLEEHLVDKVIKAIYVAGEFEKPGTGIALVIPVDRAVGLSSQIEHFSEAVDQVSDD
ncbi:P-II family nitrogen regulator [Thermodesulfobacteriota bacterium]